MNRFERRVLLRFLSAATKVLIFFLWLLVIIDLTKILGRPGTGSVEDTLNTIAENMVGLELAVAMAVPLGLIITICRLKSSGILPLFFAAGYPFRGFRKVFLLAAGLTLLLQTAAFELTAWTSAAWIKAPPPAASWKLGDLNIWALDGPDRLAGLKTATPVKDLILFEDDSLSVSRAPSARWSARDRAYLVSPVTEIYGPLLALDRFPEKKEKRMFLSPPSIREWLAGRAPAGEIIAGSNRLLMGMILLLLSAYLAVLFPVSRQWIIYVVFLFLAPAVALGLLYCSILTWFGDPGAWAIEAGWGVFLLGVIITLDFMARRRGLRLA